MQKNLALLQSISRARARYKPTNNNLRPSQTPGTILKNTHTPRYNNDNSRADLKNTKDHDSYAIGTRETEGRTEKKMMMCKQAEQDVPLQAEQADWLADTDEEINEQELEAHYSFMAKIQEVLPEESSSTEQPLEQVQNNDENNVFANERQHSENNTAECDDKRAALANLIANLTLDTEENKTILKQLKKANASLTQELEECKTNLDETSRALGEATSCRDRLLARKDIDIKEGLKTKAYEISVVNQKHDELVKRSLLTKSQFEGQLKEKSKVISDLKVKEEKDIDKMIEMDKQLKFLLMNEIIPYDTSDLANRFGPNREETMTLANESRSKLNKDYVKPYDYTKQNSLYEISKALTGISFINTLNDVNLEQEANEVPIVRVNPREKANKSVVTPIMKDVAQIPLFRNPRATIRSYFGGAFRKSTCCLRDLQGNDLLTCNRGSISYTKLLKETTSSTPIGFMAKASPTQSMVRGIEDFLI
ncbi:hypothetical protein Tco_1032957 [Tanacetum coccineum]|uniref:Uncharacterized protein n=1 Tax=Tanacetum coccineum TaxID=301880 RepID=A0ABQ5GDS4_9ASTR